VRYSITSEKEKNHFSFLPLMLDWSCGCIVVMLLLLSWRGRQKGNGALVLYIRVNHVGKLPLLMKVLVIGLKYESPRPNPLIVGWKDQCLSWARQNFSDDSFVEGQRIPYESRTRWSFLICQWMVFNWVSPYKLANSSKWTLLHKGILIQA
jgi:hypothetical protein